MKQKIEGGQTDKPKPEQWEEELNKYYSFHELKGWFSERDDVVRFIRQLLLSETNRVKKEIRKKVEDFKLDEDIFYNNITNIEAIDQVKEIIKNVK